jgi:hypothetical protein
MRHTDTAPRGEWSGVFMRQPYLAALIVCRRFRLLARQV